MAGLLDIAPLAETVAIRGTAVSVTGLSACDIAALMARFPVLAEAIGGRAVTVDRLVAMAPDAIADIIAAGTGAGGNDAAIAMARSLLPEEAADLLEAIIRVTLPRGVGPLVERLGALGASLGGAASPTAPALT